MADLLRRHSRMRQIEHLRHGPTNSNGEGIRLATARPHWPVHPDELGWIHRHHGPVSTSRGVLGSVQGKVHEQDPSNDPDVRGIGCQCHH